jgi:hypothetical protein
VNKSAIWATADMSSVCADTGLCGPTAASVFGYSVEERSALNSAIDAFTLVIQAVDTLEDVDRWVPPAVKVVRILRDRAMRETEAPNYHDHHYRTKFSELLNAEPIGPWLLDPDRRALLAAVHYLGSENSFLDAFMQWRQVSLSEKQRRKWRSLQTLVEHFKRWQTGTVASSDRRSEDEKKNEEVRTEGHKADAAALAEIEQVRRDVLSEAVNDDAAFWTVLRGAGAERVVECIEKNDAREFATTICERLGLWLKDCNG